MKNNKVTPIRRNNKFFSEEDFSLEIEMARESVEGDGNFIVVLYRVDRLKTQSDDIYNEGSKDGIRFLPPVELAVIPIIEEGENKSYNSNGGARVVEDGILTFEVYDAQLKELEVEITYGDYIGYQVDEYTTRYYSVANDGAKNFDNKHTIMGYKPALKTVVCSPVDQTEFFQG